MVDGHAAPIRLGRQIFISGKLIDQWLIKVRNLPLGECHAIEQADNALGHGADVMLDLGRKCDVAKQYAPAFVDTMIVALKRQLPSADNYDSMKTFECLLASGKIEVIAHRLSNADVGW